MSTVHHLPIAPRRVVVHDVTEVDLASQIRAGLVTAEEIAVRYMRSGFADWFDRQGLKIFREGFRRPAPHAGSDEERAV